MKIFCLTDGLLVCSTVTAHAQDRVSTIAFAAGASADWFTTYRFLDSRYVVVKEVNPALAWIGRRPATVVAAGAALDVAGVIALKKTIGKNHPRIASTLMYAATGFRVWLAFHNERQYRREVERRFGLPTYRHWD